MAIDVDCPQCGKHFRLPDIYSGRRGNCSNCRYQFRIPGEKLSPSNHPPAVPQMVPTASSGEQPLATPTAAPQTVPTASSGEEPVATPTVATAPTASSPEDIWGAITADATLEEQASVVTPSPRRRASTTREPSSVSRTRAARKPPAPPPSWHQLSADLKLVRAGIAAWLITALLGTLVGGILCLTGFGLISSGRQPQLMVFLTGMATLSFLIGQTLLILGRRRLHHGPGAAGSHRLGAWSRWFTRIAGAGSVLLIVLAFLLLVAEDGFQPGLVPVASAALLLATPIAELFFALFLQAASHDLNAPELKRAFIHFFDVFSRIVLGFLALLILLYGLFSFTADAPAESIDQGMPSPEAGIFVSSSPTPLATLERFAGPVGRQLLLVAGTVGIPLVSLTILFFYQHLVNAGRRALHQAAPTPALVDAPAPAPFPEPG